MIAASAEARAVVRGIAPDWLEAHGGSDALGAAWEALQISERFEVVVTGVGKANGAGGAARVMDRDRHCGVVSIGVAGMYEPTSGGTRLELGQRVAVVTSLFADEGVVTPQGFETAEEMGFAPAEGVMTGAAGMAVSCDHHLLHDDNTLERADEATVSTCSGTDTRARFVRDRTGAMIETMEGAAVGLVARRVAFDVPFVHLRVISNTTGDRKKQVWNLPRALEELSKFAAVL